MLEGCDDSQLRVQCGAVHNLYLLEPLLEPLVSLERYRVDEPAATTHAANLLEHRGLYWPCLLVSDTRSQSWGGWNGSKMLSRRSALEARREHRKYKSFECLYILRAILPGFTWSLRRLILAASSTVSTSGV